MNLLFIKIRTYSKLGFGNLLRVFLYRLYGSFRIGDRTNAVDLKAGPLFCIKDLSKIPNFEASTSWMDRGLWFSFHEFEINGIPDWHANPFKKGVRAVDDTAWNKISDFNDKVGDIKTVWEASRFDWVLAMAQRIASGDENELDRLNNWLQDWIIKNPPYMGVNWKCGQEASIRVMHLAMATVILEQSDTPSEFLKRLIFIHLQRIKPTTSYAIAQCNNHATSEAAALYIGGILMGGKKGVKFSHLGKKILESQVKRLVSIDGSFSQYSINYHRVMLDTLSMVEVWRQKVRAPKFSETFYKRAQAASFWLFNMINIKNGEGPNIGANDGARLLPLTNTKYRDFRPTVQLAYNLFFNQRAIEEFGPWDDSLKWLKISASTIPTVKANSFNADKGGFSVLRKREAMVMLKYPVFKFRPSHADALHVDLWINGFNFLRDGGTYSYNTDKKWLNYFSGIESHNTIQFDGVEQMPKISRFLFGDWLKTSSLEKIREKDGKTSFGAGYVCRRGISHYRRISLSSSSLLVDDEIKGFKGKAELRWRLAPGKWEIVHEDGGIKTRSLDFPEFSLSVNASAPWVRCELRKGWESLHYFEKMSLPVLEIETRSACSLITEVRWSN